MCVILKEMMGYLIGINHILLILLLSWKSWENEFL